MPDIIVEFALSAVANQAYRLRPCAVMLHKKSRLTGKPLPKGGGRLFLY